MKNKSIYLLIGPKGSGKSYIGTLIDEYLSIPFLRVEDWAKEVKKQRNIDDPTYQEEVFKTIEIGVRKRLENADAIVFESTGLGKSFDQMFESLKQDYNVITVKIVADSALCLARVKSRDQSIHVNVSDDDVQFINQQVVDKEILTDFEIDNNRAEKEQLIDELRRIISKR